MLDGFASIDDSKDARSPGVVPVDPMFNPSLPEGRGGTSPNPDVALVEIDISDDML